MSELRSGTGPVNLSATAKAYAISRGTLLRYIKETPGLAEALDARRATSGRGYVAKARGTKETRAAGKNKLAQVRATTPPPVDRPLPPAIAAALQGFLDDMTEWDDFVDRDGAPLP